MPSKSGQAAYDGEQAGILLWAQSSILIGDAPDCQARRLLGRVDELGAHGHEHREYEGYCRGMLERWVLSCAHISQDKANGV